MSNVPPTPHPDTPTVDQPAPSEPPSSVAGVDALGDPGEDSPGFEVRDRRFRVATDLPTIFLQKVMSDGLRVERLRKRVRVGDDGRPIDPADPATTKWERANGELIARSYDVMLKMVHPDERDEFEDWLCDIEPGLGSEEQAALMADATAAIAGRPTEPPPT